MKSLRKSFLTLLALTLFGGAGAWAQGPTNVTQITTDMIASWQGVSENITLADLQALGLEAVDASVAQAWTGAPQDGYAILICGFNEGNGSLLYIFFDNGNGEQPSYSTYSKSNLYNDVANSGLKWFYTGAPEPAEIELTKSGANQWTLGQTPDYDLELQVSYYDQYTLDSIPLDWQVKVGNAAPVYPTAYTEGNTSLGHLTITETDSVELIPPADVKPNVKNVTLTEPLQTLQIGGDVTGTIYYLQGETWRQAIQNHPTENNTSDEMNGWSVWGDPNKVWKGEAKLYSGGNPVDPDTAISSSLQYQLQW